ncbi:glycosyltransferase [Streptomyces sp. NPDC086023]|uniref:glycosyltransferase n=1 Tax=Streptomyces sp. NPDC086023 TaxID=3365746 RepID=UPI0037D6E123
MAERTRFHNIFFVGIDVDSMGGSQRVLHTLAQGMGEHGHSVELIGIRPSPEPFPYNGTERAYAHRTLYEAPKQDLPKPRTLTDRLSPSRLSANRRTRAARDRARAILRNRFAAVGDGYVVFGSPWAVDWALPVAWGRLKGIGQYHESFEQARRSANLRLMQRHYGKLEKTLVLSEEDAARFCSAHLPNVAVMPNPLPFFPEQQAALSSKKIGAVGGLHPVKCYDRLIEAFALCSSRRPGWELHLFGHGPMEDELRRTAAEHGVGNRVVFRGAVQDMRAVYTELSMIALSSEAEGRPMALAEAAACGVPAVAFDVSGGVREIVSDGRTGTLVPPGDVAALANSLGQMMDDDGLRARYALAARRHVQQFALPAVLNRWHELFDELDR